MNQLSLCPSCKRIRPSEESRTFEFMDIQWHVMNSENGLVTKRCWTETQEKTHREKTDKRGNRD